MSTDDLNVKWLPLESNPDVINKYVNNIGVSTDNFEFADIYGLDAELLQMVPKPAIAVLLLFPVTDKYQEYEKAKVEALGGDKPLPANVFFTKQTVQNACGTVALIHALANNQSHLSIDQEKAFAKFLEATKSMSPEECAEYLKTDEGITSAHQDSANEGQTETPNLEDDVDLHFIAFVHIDGQLYELDGAKPFPINHGPTSEDKLLEDTCEIVKKLVALNPEEVRFNLIGLVAKNSS